jgi:membrane-bound serine protease (ClpP class)
MRQLLFSLLLSLVCLGALAQDRAQRVYTFDVKEEIGPPIWLKMQKAFAQAEEWDADLILLHMNTYGGMVIHADSMRTRILNSKIPVWVFIDNNAASAGALIAISCDSIYMRQGANIGAATVVDQTGGEMPDKYQSYMRSTMRSTAEAKGRNPDIAQAMVDASIHIDGIIDSGKVLTFTASEAITHGFCEGMYENIPDLLTANGIDVQEMRRYEPTTLETVIGWLVNPAVSGLLIMVIIGGIYFELQTPGVGFPLAAAATAAALYFAPLYLEGLAENWEILVFLAGLVLLMLEVFVIPGFGVAGISGIALMVAGLTLALMGNVGLEFAPTWPEQLTTALGTVILSAVGGTFLSFYLAKRLITSKAMHPLVLDSTQPSSDGFVGVDVSLRQLIGQEGSAYTVLRPSGKVEVNGEVHDATSHTGFIDRGAKVRIVAFETGTLVVREKLDS